MKYYDQNVAIVMDFLENHNYGSTSVCQHKRCYKLLKTYLEQNHLHFSDQHCDSWYFGFRESLPVQSTSYMSMHLALKRLQDVYDTGIIRDIHITLSKPPYQLLDTDLKAELDDFIHFKKSQGYPDSYTNVIRSTGSRFMLFLMDRNVKSIKICSYYDILDFFDRKSQTDNALKDRCDCIASEILGYYAKDTPKLFGMSLALNKTFMDQIIKDFSFMNPSSNDRDIVPIDNLWDVIEGFLLEMKSTRYSDTVLKSSRHTLVLLYIFRNMYDRPLDEEAVWQWFDYASGKFGTGWKQYRRSLSQFLLFTRTGKLTTFVTGLPYKNLFKDTLSDSLKAPLEGFLLLKKREKMAKSTCGMYRSSIARLVRFMCSQGIESYRDITPDFLVEFNKQDRHATVEGKQAYNSKIRGFLKYLFEEGIVENPYIAESIPTVVSRRTRIPSVLTTAEISSLLEHQIPAEDVNLLRAHGIVMLGLFTGLRASDVAALKFSNIDWSNRSISIIQQKTGKFVKLYLPVEAGNALYRYLKYGRPNSELPYVFLNHRAPYGILHKSVCTRSLYRFLPVRKGSSEGFHILRKTFATNMLQGSNSTFIIADALGHQGDGTVYTYLGMNPDKMRRCPLKWMGGDFFA